MLSVLSLKFAHGENRVTRAPAPWYGCCGIFLGVDFLRMFQYPTCTCGGARSIETLIDNSTLHNSDLCPRHIILSAEFLVLRLISQQRLGQDVGNRSVYNIVYVKFVGRLTVIPRSNVVVGPCSFWVLLFKFS